MAEKKRLPHPPPRPRETENHPEFLLVLLYYYSDTHFEVHKFADPELEMMQLNSLPPLSDKK